MKGNVCLSLLRCVSFQGTLSNRSKFSFLLSVDRFLYRDGPQQQWGAEAFEKGGLTDGESRQCSLWQSLVTFLPW